MEEADGIAWFPEYRYTGITGTLYTPHFKNNHWYVVPNTPVSFYHFVYLCKIPDDEAFLLRLKFGGAGVLQHQQESI